LNVSNHRAGTPPGQGPLSHAPDNPRLILFAGRDAAADGVARHLSEYGYNVATAEDAESAFAACIERRPDLCILDLALPAASGRGGPDEQDSVGFDLCRKIRRDPRTSRIPVIFLTSQDDPSQRVSAIESGGDDYITRPHNSVLLDARVKSLLRLRAATEELESSYRRLREMEKVRDDILKMIVHDLKTPLTAVLATLEMLLDGDFGAVSETQRRAITDIEGKAEDLLLLIEDLLEVARIDEVDVALHLQPIAPAAFLAEVMHEWEHRLRQEGATASMEVADDAPVFEADKGLIKRVFSNLVQNALVHGAGHVHVRLAARRDGDGVLFTVADNGPGIPQEYHELIFRKFALGKSRRDAPRARSSGLGLAFCRVVVDAHGGRIWVRSAEGQGSSFYISLPATPRARVTSTQGEAD
jgi:signal transduction histidine kinase